MSGSDDVPPPPTPQTQPQHVPHTMSTVKLPILKKGEYDIWAMKMEHYLAHTDYPIWEVIQKGNGPVSITTDTQGVVKVLPPRTAEEALAREKERKAKTTLLMALPEDHLAKFHKMTDAKEMWDAIKSRFGGNDESKKMQKYILKQQFEGFTISNSEGLHIGYDRFQSLLSQLEIHSAGVSTEDTNQKFLRSLPSSQSQVSLIMRTKPGIDDLSFDDLYNNLRVFEYDIKGSNTSSSSSPNVAFISSESTNSTNKVSTANGASPSSSHNSKKETSSSYTDDIMHSFFANQSSGRQLDHEDLEQINEYDLEEMDLKWQVTMIFMRLKKFYKKTGRKLHFDAKEPVGFDKTKVECYNCHKTGHFARECRLKGSQDARRRDAGNCGHKVKDNGRRPGKQEEPNALVTLDGEGIDWTAHAEDEQEDFALMAFNNSSSNTKAYAQGLKKVEAQLVTHQNNQLWYEQKIRLGYGDHRFDGILSYENEVLQSVFMNNDSNTDDRTLNDRFVTTDGMHAVPPPMTGNYMPSGPDIEIDESQFTYGPKQPQSTESDTRSSDFDFCESNSSVETPNYMPEPVVIDPKVKSSPKVWNDAPIIEEYESDSDDECVATPSSEQEQPRETVQEHTTSSQSPKVKKKDLNGSKFTKMGLGYGCTRNGCYVCGSFTHLIKDCDFHKKRMAKKDEMNKMVSKSTNQRDNRPIWNNEHNRLMSLLNHLFHHSTN
ncbi:ribonuclease H-like domain-containing protein [Tanacetum coccineum]|uniref:Ribonuclease H-like domain-containing protein n=1 Tax=Tanacetum coccineum TaxID=301880 RepID=A0ABQ5D6H2_9ASTR